MEPTLLTFEQVGELMPKDGKPATRQVVSYRLKKLQARGWSFNLRTIKGPKGRWVSGLTRRDAERLCRAWKNSHL